MMPTDSATYPRLDLVRIRQELAASPIGHTIVYHRTVPSTMPLAADLARQEDTPSGVVVVAEEQTHGRGRHERTWHAPHASALLVSVILKPPHTHAPHTLTMVAGNALLAAVTDIAPTLRDQVRLKWPNDLVLGSDPTTARKLAGILAESARTPDGALAYAILGIGINVNQQRSDLPRIAPPTLRATSIRVATGAVVDRSALLVQLCRQLAEALADTPAQNFARWKAHLATLGHAVAVHPIGVEQRAMLTGKAVDVQEDGALVVVDEAGNRHTFHAADVSIRPTPT